MHKQIEFARHLVMGGHARVRGKWEVYHGFSKMSLPDLTELSRPFGFEKPEELLVELVEMSGRVDKGCHVHQDTTAVVLLLGKEHGFEDPAYLSQIYLKPESVTGKWHPARPGDAFLILPGTVHDFEPGGGKMYFLSVQNPKLFDPVTGRDDFHLVVPDAEPYRGLTGVICQAAAFFRANHPWIDRYFELRSLIQIP